MSTAVERAIKDEQDELFYSALKMAALARMKDVLGLEWIYASRDYSNLNPGRVKITAGALRGCERAAVKESLAALGIKRADKAFDADTGQVVYTMSDGMTTLVIKGASPDRCEVEKVEEVIEVPEKIEPAHTETRVRYRLKDPKCLGESEPTVPVEPAAVDAPVTA